VQIHLLEIGARIPILVLQNQPMTKIFVVGFPREMDELGLAQLFAPYDEIELLTIVRDKFTGRSKGFGFIHLKSNMGAQDAIRALNGLAIADRKLEVRLADEKVMPAPYVAEKRENPVPPRKKRPRLSR
jgi:RNA recognition motif-containing protein